MIGLVQFFLLLLATVVVYFLVAFMMPATKQACDCDGKEFVTVYLYHNDALLSHTEIIMDIAPFSVKFRDTFPDLLPKDARGYIAFSYGDRDFMMDKGGFDDINLTLALRGLFLNTPALIKVGHYRDFYREKCQKILLTKKALTLLVQSILDSFVQREGSVVAYHDSYHRYYIHYYLAKEPYNLFHTCNAWTGDRLREAGVKMPYWTPLAQNITSQLP